MIKHIYIQMLTSANIQYVFIWPKMRNFWISIRSPNLWVSSQKQQTNGVNILHRFRSIRCDLIVVKCHIKHKATVAVRQQSNELWIDDINYGSINYSNDICYRLISIAINWRCDWIVKNFCLWLNLIDVNWLFYRLHFAFRNPIWIIANDVRYLIVE